MSLIIHNTGPIVTGFPGEKLFAEEAAKICFSDGTAVDAQVKKLLPDWFELSFNADRTGKATVEFTEQNLAGEFLASANGAILDNGLIQIKLNRDASLPPVEIHWNRCSGTLTPKIKIAGKQPAESGESRQIKITRNGALRCRVEITGSFAESMNYRIALELWKDNPALQLENLLCNVIKIKDYQIVSAVKMVN